MSKFGSNLRKIRKDNKISQMKLGEQLGYGYTTIANYESGRNEPSIDVLIKIADYFDVSMDYLIGRETGSGECVRLGMKEVEVLSNYRHLNQDQKRMIVSLMDSLVRVKV